MFPTDAAGKEKKGGSLSRLVKKVMFWKKDKSGAKA
jgi:hypothetical protein